MVMGDLVTEVDVAVLGGGPGGYSAAFRCAELGLETVVVDAGKRLGGAVIRNRVRRRLREGMRAVLPRIRNGWDIMLIARPESAGASSEELHAAIVDLAHRGGLLKPESG